MDTPTITGETTKINQKIQHTLKEVPNYKFENGGFLLDQYYIYLFSVRLLPISLNKQHQMSSR